MQGMKQAMEIIDRKKAEKEEKMRLAREVRRKAKEAEDIREDEARKHKSSAWKFW
jgi:cytochrome c oxidase assembly protein subunit 20